MGWFTKTKEDKDLQIFLSEFPTWAAIHSAQLADELLAKDEMVWGKILKNTSKKSELINGFIGAHLVYLSLRPEGEIARLLFGKDILEKSLASLPNKAKASAVLVLSFYEKDSQKGEQRFSSSMESFYKIKIDPLDACVAFILDKEVNNSEEFSSLIAGLLPTLNSLQVEQLEWLKNMTEEWSKVK